MSIRLRALCAASSFALVAVFAAGGAKADSVAYNAPNIVSVPGATSATLGGQTFVNQGLVGAARLPADLHDFNGETLGSFSGMALDLSTWRRNSDGSYSASLFTLPDRGPNNIGGFTTTDYAARLNKFTFGLRPNTGGPVAAKVQQATLTQSGGFLLRDTTGQVFTGRDPQAGVVVRGGIAYPTPPAGDPGFGKIALDAEAVSFLADGSFYIGDEYAAGIYYFDASGRQIGAIQANPDLLPRVNGAVNFNGANDSPLVAGTTGRRSNQGMEGLSVSPDGTRLFAVLQSGTLQDNPTNTAVRRNNTRVMVYDISTNKTPTAPINEYVLQLPVYNNSATGTGNATATAAQSEVLALNNSQFLVLARDGNGRGGNANAIAYKSILLVDIAGATDINGTPYSGTTPISTTAAANGSGALVPGVTPVQQVELVNMLNAAQLANYGVNLNPAPSTQYTLSEKWEAMALAPVLDESKPNDYFLLVGNDNDFVSNDVDAAGVTDANAALNSPTAGVGNNDNVVMVYRLTLPTYIDPQALAWLKRAAPIAMAQTRGVAAEFAAAGPKADIDTLDLVRRAHYSGADVGGFRAWAQGGWRRAGGLDGVGRTDGGEISVGMETGSNRLRAGISINGSDYQGKQDDLFRVTGHSFGVSVYGAVYDPSGFYVEGAVGVSRLKFKARRPASYGLMAQGSTAGDAVFGELQAGYSAVLGPLRAGPFVDVVYGDVAIDGYLEHGAAIGNGLVPTNRYKRGELTVGLEATFAQAGAIRPTLRAGYTMVDEAGLRIVPLTLGAVANSGTLVNLPTSERPFARVEGALEGEFGGMSWRLGAELRDTRGETSGRVVLGLAKRF